MRDTTTFKITSILLEWNPSSAPEDAPNTMVTSRSGLNSLLASLGRPAFDVMGEFGPGGVAVTCTTLTDGKFDQMKALLFATVDAVATPSSPCRSEADWLVWGQSRIDRMSAADAAVFDITEEDLRPAEPEERPTPGRTAPDPVRPTRGRSTRAAAAAVAAEEAADAAEALQYQREFAGGAGALA